MDIRRVVLWAALAFVVYSLWNHWQADYPQAVPNASLLQDNAVQKSEALSEMDALPASMTATPPTLSEGASVDFSKIIHVKTDVLDLRLDLEHGDILDASLLNYPQSVADQNKPFQLLQSTPGARYVANSHWFSVDRAALKNMDPVYSSAQDSYVLPGGAPSLSVELKGKNQDGLVIAKTFVFKRGSYLIDIHHALLNEGSAAWTGYLNMQLLRSSPKEDQSSLFHVGSYTGASYSNPGQHRYQKLSFKNMAKANMDVKVKGGWLAMQEHYFLSAWIPTEGTEQQFYSRVSNQDYSIGAISQPMTLLPSAKGAFSSRLYLGPELPDVLRSIAPGLDLTVDYGWLWFLSSFLFSLMSFIHGLVGNWGWSIVLVTVLIKLAFYRLSATSYKSMAGMRKLQPKLQALRERYGDDKAKISQATMELYRQEKLNPLGGCLPIVIQIPVFIALYWVLLESVALRQAPFIFWIQDLASSDPYHVLPVIMGATMLIQQKLNPAPPDPTQAKVLMFLPILFTALFWNFPSGLVLYWIVNNTLSILQQWSITRTYSDTAVSKKRLVAKN